MKKDIKEIASPVTRVNALLKKAGHPFRLVRGGGYYYLRHAAFSSSIYVYKLERTEKEFQFARNEVNEILARNDLATI